MWIQQGTTKFTQPEEMARLCDPVGIERGVWDISTVDPSVCREAAKNPEYQAQIFKAIEAPLKALKEAHGYLSEDVVCLSPETPNLDAILAKFDKTHHHTDDEVRVVLSGNGIFGIVPPDSEPFDIHVQAGDLIVVPAYTRHWFTLAEDRFIVALRVFMTPAGWEAVYEPVTATPPAAVG
jgi:1,2-dihydroxy-3-keto-5-methylthiopentene dioxygenase